MRIRALAPLLALPLLLAGCGPLGPHPDLSPLAAPPVDRVKVRSIDEVVQWPHRHMLEADLDGDGVSERILLAADVRLNARGEPLWEDGHRWALWVEGKGTRTLLYAAFVPHGVVEAAVMGSDRSGRRHVLVNESTPQQVRTLELAYDRPGQARTVSAAYYQVERWIPPLAPR